MNVAENLRKHYSLEGKVVLITGAGGGICSEMARAVAGAGAEVALCDLNLDAVRAVLPTMQGAGHTAHRVDLRRVSEIEACVDEVLAAHGRIDGLVNGAGVSKRLGLLDVDEALYDAIMDVNLKAAFFMGQQVVRKAMRGRGGKIVNIASYNSTRICGGSSVYGCAKSGILGLTRSMAVEWGGFGIQANAIAPGFIETPLCRELKEDQARLSCIEDMTCCRRMAQPEELMGMTILLLSDASSYMTGQVYNVDGGALAGGTPWYFPTAYGAKQHAETE
ncbi:SDR family oxidoreductase [Butyricicoccus faecihominis]|uniref:SDR family NAD(P)-dependent oxidoreductase n=1 Tax=Butyricicoccus faecihominis TaxID=1712515 RepID=UPI00247ABA00|nr:SDR family oxidoreductase [Butyricicoccus faecihominis]MCQ5128434.1 SDR family oxidoreductase [Butyricicoccus faecihominis]